MKKISGLALRLTLLIQILGYRQLSPFNDQLGDFREPPPPFNGRNSLTDRKEKTSDVP